MDPGRLLPCDILGVEMTIAPYGLLLGLSMADAARLAGARVVVTDNRRPFVALLRHGIRVWSAAEYVEGLGLQPTGATTGR